MLELERRYALPTHRRTLDLIDEAGGVFFLEECVCVCVYVKKKSVYVKKRVRVCV